MANENNGRSRLFLGCFIALVATAFGFIVRALIIDDWSEDFRLTETQTGNLLGAGLYPFAFSIILFSLFIDRIGYGKTMVFAFLCHIVSAILTIRADSYVELYVATFIFAIGNGTVEAVINPVVATVYTRQKTHMLNILHAGWPGGLVLGGVLTIFMGDGENLQFLTGDLWRWKVGLVLLPTILYGILLMNVRFPVSERVAAGVSYREMLREFGSLSCFVVSFMIVFQVAQILTGAGLATEIPQYLLWIVIFAITIAFHLAVGSFGQPIFVILMLVMIPLAVTELGTDSWIASLMEEILSEEGVAQVAQYGAWVLVYTSAIMFVLRFFAGPIVHRISPLGLLCACAAIAAVGLFWLSTAVGVAMIFAAATCYGVGKTFFWPTTLGVVAERFPKGGALTLNSIAGVGMLAAGILGTPIIGFVQDTGFASRVQRSADTELAQQFLTEEPWALGSYQALNKVEWEELQAATNPEEVENPDPALVAKRREVEEILKQSKQSALAKIAVLPCIMLACYIGLILYFKSRGGYKAEVLAGHAADDEKFTGGVAGPVE
ncbi:MAG: MFS transporter [Pirellulales bacterium]